MNRNKLLIGLIIAVMVIAGGAWLYDWVLGDTEEASGQIVAPTLAPATTAPLETVEVVSASEAPKQEYASTPASQESGSSNAEVLGGSLATYQISQQESQVRFIIYEELNGQPKNVVGVTNQVAGEVAVNLNDLSTAAVGQILINARTLETDDGRRNQAIRNRILHTDQYEYITFTPIENIGLSGSAEPGQSFTFQIAGDLTIQDVTRRVVFDITGQVDATRRLVGNATSLINRSDFNLIVPNVPFVANVKDEVRLEFDIVLLPVG